MQRVWITITGVLLAMAVCLSVAGCGASSAGSGTSATATVAITCHTPTPSAAAARLGRQARTALRVIPVTTLPPGVAVGQVQISVEGSHFGAHDTIALWAGNGLGQCIYTTDHHSDCTIVTLQRQAAGAWQSVADCPLASPTRIVDLPNMQAIFVRLQPEALGAQAGGWSAGTYRVAFSYTTQQQGLGQQTEVDSASFTVG